MKRKLIILTIVASVMVGSVVSASSVTDVNVDTTANEVQKSNIDNLQSKDFNEVKGKVNNEEINKKVKNKNLNNLKGKIKNEKVKDNINSKDAEQIKEDINNKDLSKEKKNIKNNINSKDKEKIKNDINNKDLNEIKDKVENEKVKEKIADKDLNQMKFKFQGKDWNQIKGDVQTKYLNKNKGENTNTESNTNTENNTENNTETNINTSEEVKITAPEGISNSIVINNEAVSTTYINDNNQVMIPLRAVAEPLGYEIDWDDSTKTITLSKGNSVSYVKVGYDEYTVNKMVMPLGTAPVIVDGTTYVPVEFLDQVLGYSYTIDNNGNILVY